MFESARRGRTVAGAALVLLAVALAGCGGQKTETGAIAAQPFAAHDRCHMCGMTIAHYEGPKAEVFVKGAEDTPLKFCSGRDAFTWALQPENARRLKAFFVHDMGSTVWAKPDDKALIDATGAVFVYGHDIAGVMGDEPAAFATRSAARAFAAEHGGRLYGYPEVTLELLNR